MSVLPEQVLSFFDFIGSLVCHQRTEKTLIVGGRFLPVCTRCTGAYLGLLIGYVILLFRKKKAKGPPNLWVTLVLSMPMIIDTVTQTLGMRESTNSLRLITGLFFGVVLLPFLIYVLQLVPGTQHLTILSVISPKKPQIDDIENPWMSSRALLLGALTCLGTFFAMNYATNSSNPYLYWIMAFPIVFSIIPHIFLLPTLILGSLVYDFLKSRATRVT